MHPIARIATFVVALAMVLVSSFCAAPPADAQQQASATISGSIVDATSGLPLSGVTVSSNGPTSTSATSGSDGHFTLSVAPGVYTLSATIGGYQGAQSDTITAASGVTPNVTLSLQRAAATRSLQTIGRTTSNRAESLQTASVVYRDVDTRAITEQGFYRVADALRQLPGLNQGSNNETAAPADDMSLTIRGIGRLETQVLYDGHPVALGLRNPYNFEISPASLFSDAQVIYGSGADAFFPTNAIGGIVNMRSLEPTTKNHASFTQQYGSFGQLGTQASATGSFGRGFGYAVAASSTGIDGPFRGLNLYNPTAALDPASPGVYQQTGQYRTSNASFTRALLGKLAIPLGTGTKLTLSGMGIAFYDDKTGNGDNDYLRYSTALAQANGTLPNVSQVSNTYSAYDAMGNKITGTDGKSVTGTCGAGLVAGVNTNGVPYGSYTILGPNNSIGVPGTLGANAPAGTSPSAPCVTPAQWAQINSGWQGAGEAYQTYDVTDAHARLNTNLGHGVVSIDGYTDGYKNHYDRFGLASSLPYNNAPGDTGFSNDDIAVNSGFVASDTYATERNVFSLGFYNNTTAYRHLSSLVESASAIAHENAFFVREAYTFANTPLTIYANAWAKHSSVTNTSYTDPRVALVYARGNDVIRLAAGVTSTQPQVADLTAAFSPSAPSSLIGATCSPVNPCSIGGGSPSSNLKPERGVDTEISFGHRFQRNSIVQLTLYNTNVSNKIYSYTAPLSIAGVGKVGGAAGVNPYLPIATAAGGACVTAPLTCLGVSGDVNVGQVLARGIELNGRQAITRDLSIDEDYGTESVSLAAADQSLLAVSSTLILKSQLPFVPLHKYNLGLDYQFSRALGGTFRIAYHHVDQNNPKNLPAYGYADMRAGVNAGPGRLTVSVNNLFNALADYHGYFFEGQPLATNSYAGGVPQVTERFMLPYRTIQLTFSIAR